MFDTKRRRRRESCHVIKREDLKYNPITSCHPTNIFISCRRVLLVHPFRELQSSPILAIEGKNSRNVSNLCIQASLKKNLEDTNLSTSPFSPLLSSTWSLFQSWTCSWENIVIQGGACYHSIGLECLGPSFKISYKLKLGREKQTLRAGTNFM